VAANESSEHQPLPPLAALPAGTLNDKLVRRHDPVEHAPLKPQQLGPEQEEGPSTSPVADALISDLGDAQTLEDLLEVLQARIALGEEVSEEGMLVSVHKLCDFLGVRETKQGRWSALTLDKTFQEGALWQRSQSGAKVADILSAAATRAASRMAPARLACVIEGLAAAGAYNLALLRTAEKILEPHLEHMEKEVVATLVVAWAEAGLRPTHSFLEAAADTLLADLRSCNADTLTGTLLGYAKLGYCHDGLLDAVAKAVLSSLEGFTMCQLSYVLWSFSKLGVKHPQLVDDITVALLPKMSPKFAHSMTVSCWSLAALNHYDSMTGVLLDAVAEVLITNVADFQAKDISRLMWTYAELNHPHHRMVEAVLKYSVNHLHIFDASGLANIVWGAAKTDEAMDDNVARMLAGVGAEASQRIEEFAGLDMANLLSGYAHLRYFHSDLLKAVEEHMHRHLVNLPPRQLARLILSFARLNYSPRPALLQELAFFLTLNLPKMNGLSAVQAMWGIGVLEGLTVDMFNRFCACLANMDIQEFTVQNQMRLIDIEMMANQLGQSQAEQAALMLPDNVRGESLETTQAAVRYNSSLLTSLQREIMMCLLTMGVPYKVDAITANGCIKVDLAMCYHGKNLAIEVADRRRHSSNPPFHPMGKMVLRERVLEANGWRVIRVPSHEWESMRTLENKIKYMGNRLDTALLNGPAREPVSENDLKLEEIEPSVWKFWW